MDNLHPSYIVASVEFRLNYILCTHRRRILANIYRWQHDYQHDTELLVHSCMDLDSVHSNKPNGMDNRCLMCIRVVRMKPTDFHDIHPSNSNVHDDCNLIDRWHCDRIEFDHKLQRNFDSHKLAWVGNHYRHGNQLKGKNNLNCNSELIFSRNFDFKFEEKNKISHNTYFHNKRFEHFRCSLHGKHTMVCALERDRRHFHRRFYPEHMDSGISH